MAIYIGGLFALLLAASCIAPAQYNRIAIQPLSSRTFVAEPVSSVAYAFDGTYEYVGTTKGLYRTLSLAGQDFEPRLESPVNAIRVHDGALYVLLEGLTTAHTVLRSEDSGMTFTPLDRGLEECIAGSCRFLSATQIDFAPGRIFLAAGGNLLVSNDGGAAWKVLYPWPNTAPATQVCPLRFGRSDTRVVIAGECPLDEGFVTVGTLRGDLLEWDAAPRRLTAPGEIPELENRNGQFVMHLGDETWIGVEGGLLAKCGSEATFRYAIHFPLSGRHYPYIRHFLAPSKYENVRIAGGFDKAASGPYLAWSADRGATWNDVSHLLPPDSMVAGLAERRDGQPVVFVQRGDSISISQIAITEVPPRRRAAGR